MPIRETDQEKIIARLTASRAPLAKLAPRGLAPEDVEEGGCGVTGFASTIKVAGRHIFEPSKQMHNRGNGKGGGIAALGLSHEDLGVSEEMVREDYLLQVAYLNPECQKALEEKYINPLFDVEHVSPITPIADYRDLPGLDVRPPDVTRYFVRVKDKVLDSFMKDQGLDFENRRRAEDEFVYQNTFKLSSEFYAGGKQQAFVLSHGRDLMVLKIVGYAERVVQYYQLDDFRAHAWIAHQRYPTKGRVWHPGGAHPFVGLNEALVHNGDFANYHSTSEYLKQRNIHPLFYTDTEVSVLMFDLLTRTFGYPLEYVIEALAPTTEMDFDQLPPEKQEIYRLIQACHIHGSPDGPWFFIIARNDTARDRYQLIGITDTAMLRPQVFALMDAPEVQVGLVCSEKQAIDATLNSLADEDPRFGRVADQYWNARGGSHTDGGSFIFNIEDNGNGGKKLVTTDKFGNVITAPGDQTPLDKTQALAVQPLALAPGSPLAEALEAGDANLAFQLVTAELDKPGYAPFAAHLDWLKKQASASDAAFETSLAALSLLIDRRYDTHDKRRRSLVELANQAIDELLGGTPLITQGAGSRYARVDFATREHLAAPRAGQEVLVIDAFDFEPEGDDCDARVQVEAFNLGWRKFICYRYKGQRFTGCGFGPATHEVSIQVYGASGDYLASGIDGMEIVIHGNGQDQLAQIMKDGKLVVHGDVGQAFMYGAKGGSAFVLGNAAGRPLINGVGRPKVVINGTCLDYLAESFMAGDPHNGGGFVILNGVTFDHHGRLVELESPYPGANLFSLASGGAIYIRDPFGKIVDEQLNGGMLDTITRQDWELILPYLKENERLFGVLVEEHLLTVEGSLLDPGRVYRKVKPAPKVVLPANEEAAVPE